MSQNLAFKSRPIKVRACRIHVFPAAVFSFPSSFPFPATFLCQPHLHPLPPPLPPPPPPIPLPPSLTLGTYWARAHNPRPHTNPSPLPPSPQVLATAEDGSQHPVCSFVRPLQLGRLLGGAREAARFVSLLRRREDLAPLPTAGQSEVAECWCLLHTVLASGSATKVRAWGRAGCRVSRWGCAVVVLARWGVVGQWGLAKATSCGMVPAVPTGRWHAQHPSSPCCLSWTATPSPPPPHTS